MKNKGFTLIELLAVIVILAIIALIAVPIILNIIENSKRSAVVRSGELYLGAVEQTIMRKNLEEEFKPASCEIQSNGNLICDEKVDLIVETDGDRPTSGTINFEDGKITTVEEMLLTGYVLEKTNKDSLQIKGASSDNNNDDKDDNGDEKTYTGTVYRNSRVNVNLEDSIKPWCMVVSEMGLSSCEENEYDVYYLFKTQGECEGALQDAKSNSDPIMQALAASAVCEIDEISYETKETLSNLPDYYLKHEVVKDIVKASYACLRLDGTEYCIQGGDGGSSYDKNVSEIKRSENYFTSNGGACGFNDSFSYCRVDSLYLLDARSSGSVNAAGGEVVGCNVYDDGTSTCR